MQSARPKHLAGDASHVRAALSAAPFAAFCEFKADEPPRRGRLAALCGGDASQRPAPPPFETHYKSRRPPMPVTVEAYGRSAAGVVVETGHMRTPEALEKSMHFLVHQYLRDPHTAAVFLAPFDVWRHLWDRMRQVRTNWVPQLPKVGAEMHGAGESEEAQRSARESRRRLQWLEFTVAALAVGSANLCRSVAGCRRYMEEKQNFLESMAQCFSDLVLSYRAEQRLRNSEFFSVIILFYGLSQLGKIENRAGFCRTSEVTVTNDAEPSHVFEPSSRSVDFGSVYRELAYLPNMARTRHVRIALKLIHSWCQREWFRFFFICRTEPLTVLQRAIVFQSFSYARFRAVLDLVTANVVVYSKVRLRGEMPVAELADLLLMEVEDCVELLDTMGLSEQLVEDRSVLRLSRPDSSPLTSQEAIFRHLEEGGRKPQLCLPTRPAFFGFRVWSKAFELFPDAFGPDPAVHADLRKMTCPVNVMEVLEPYCPPYNEDVCALELTDAGNEWFSDIQAARERMLRRAARIVDRLDYDGLEGDDGVNNNNNVSIGLESDENEESLQMDDEWQAVLESMDRESKSTRDSVFSDGDLANASPTARIPSDAVGSDDEFNMQNNINDDKDNSLENNTALRSAAALLESLEKDSIYAKIRDELRAKEQHAEQERKKNAYELEQRECQKKTEKEEDEEDEVSNEEAVKAPDSSFSRVHTLHSGASAPLLSIAPPVSAPVPAVVVTPLPSDDPRVMSPSLKAVVETPKSVTVSSPVVENVVVEEEEEEEEEFEKKKEKREGKDWMWSMSLSSSAAQAKQEGVWGEKKKGESNAIEEEEKDAGKRRKAHQDENTKTNLNVQTEVGHASIQPLFPAVPPYLHQQKQQQKEQPQEAVPTPKLGGSIPNPTPMFAAVKRKQQRVEESDEDEQRKRPRREFVSELSSPATREIRLPFEKSSLENTPQRSVVNPLPSSTLPTSVPAAAADADVMRRVSFAENVLPGNDGGKPSRLSYRDIVQAAVKRNVSWPVRVSSCATRQMELFDKALLAAAVEKNTREPMWMCYFMQYLARFAVCARGLRLADILRGNAIEDAAWLCRGFSIAPQPLRLASTVVIFGSGLRRGEDSAIGEKKVSLRRVAETSFEASSISTSRVLLGMEDEDNEAVDHYVGHRTSEARGSMCEQRHSDAIVTPSMRLARVQFRQSLPLALWVTSLLLSKQEAAALLMRGAVYTSDALRDAGEEQVGLWEQKHVMPRLNRGHPCGNAGSNDFAQTQVSLHAVDCSDATKLRWAASSTMSPTTTSAAAAAAATTTAEAGAAISSADASAATTRPGAECAKKNCVLTEQLSAIVALDATKRDEYAAGLETLSLLVRQAAAERVVHLPGVIVVLYTSSVSEDEIYRRKIEEHFWAQWLDALSSERKETPSEIPATSAAPEGRRAYQETIRRALANGTAGSSLPHADRVLPFATPTWASFSPRSDFFARTTNSRMREEQVTGEERKKPPSPLFVVLPLRTELRSAKGVDGDFTSMDMEVARTALTRAVETLVKGYETKWQEFLRKDNTGEEENATRKSARSV